MSSDLWLSQERIEDEFDSETWHYLLMVEIVDLISYLNLELSAYEESLKQFV